MSIFSFKPIENGMREVDKEMESGDVHGAWRQRVTCDELILLLESRVQ